MGYFKASLLIVVLCFFAITAIFSTEAMAQQYAGTIYGRRAQRGYFDNNLDGSFDDRTNGNVLPDYAGYSDAIPAFINTVPELYNYIRSNYNSNNALRRTGAAFIVNTMLDRRGGQARRTISNADWTELRSRMNARQAAGKIDWNGNTAGWINSYKQGNHNDDAFFRSYRNRPGIVFRDDNNRVIYRLVRVCANPLGDADDGLPDSLQWSVEDDSYIQRSNAQGQPTGNLGNTVSNAQPGQRYFFHHRIYNQGPDEIDRNIATWRSIDYPNVQDPQVGRQSGGDGTNPNATVRTLTGQTGVIPSTAGGQQWCSRAYADPRAHNNATTFVGELLCVNVPFNYNLRPHVSVGGGQGSTDEQGATNTRVDFDVDNDGPTQSRGTRWELIRFEVAPTAPGASATDKSPNNNSDGCATHTARPGVGNCSIQRQAEGRVFNVGNTSLGQYMYDTGNAPIGSRICFVLSVRTPTETASPSWGHSQPACIMVVKKPKVHIYGADLWVGRQFVGDTTAQQPGDITTGTSTIDGLTYGSWAEYGIFATGSVRRMASGAAIARGVPPAQAVASQIHKLTFANRPTYGAYTTNPDRIPDYIATYASDGAGVAGDVNLVASGNASYQTANSIGLIAPGTIQKGKVIVVRANNITIRDNIHYEDTYTGLAEIPRIVIIADGNVFIEPDVTRIDAWIITKNTLYTCNQSGQLTIGSCNQQLVMNGPVAAKEVSLRRTHGSETVQGRDTPAEIFNLRPDAILKAYETAVERGRAQTVYQVELPPRY